ncbi:abortive infection family protein [Sinorhizobium meliloti]|uniref:abortive infection family protein n=1 Tax=Rhizobium meliloti TaxID=382 RepID=UPI002278687F|nr:abortive infection family protein [Sinorhizobium meliloti]
MAAKALNSGTKSTHGRTDQGDPGRRDEPCDSLGTLRNRLSDSHGRGGMPVRPSPRHASLAVNTAGAAATFLVETHLERKPA